MKEVMNTLRKCGNRMRPGQPRYLLMEYDQLQPWNGNIYLWQNLAKRAFQSRHFGLIRPKSFRPLHLSSAVILRHLIPSIRPSIIDIHMFHINITFTRSSSRILLY
jgi:hypothetical protein